MKIVTSLNREEKNGRISLVIDGPGWIHPTDQKFPHNKPVATHEVEGSFVGFASSFPSNYGHLIHDHLPIIAWLLTFVPETTRFILHYIPYRPVAPELIKVVDSIFADRVMWVEYDHVVHIKRGNLLVIVPDRVPTYMGTSFMQPLQKWLMVRHPNTNILHSTDSPHGLIIFYSRMTEFGVSGGRVVEANHERDIISMIKLAMVRHGRKERFHIFNGYDDKNEPMNIRDQFLLFRTATTIIGPHGSGLANMIWLDFDRAGLSCDKRPQVLEFVAGPDSEMVQHGPGRGKYLGYQFLFRGLPIDYHNILYTDNSNNAITYIHLKALDLALDNMWDK